MITLHSIDIIESDEFPASMLKLATQKCTELIEQIAEVDDDIVELFLNDALPCMHEWVTFGPMLAIGLKPAFMDSSRFHEPIFMLDLGFASHSHTQGCLHTFHWLCSPSHTIHVSSLGFVGRLGPPCLSHAFLFGFGEPGSD